MTQGFFVAGKERRHCLGLWPLSPSLVCTSKNECPSSLTCGQRASRASVCVFFEHVMECLVPMEHVHNAHQHLAQGRNVPCSIYGCGHVRLPLVVISSDATTLLFFAGLTHLWRKPRVCRWRLHICVRSRAPGQNSSLRPNWLLNSPSFTW